jgi:hypothetical protein
VPLRIGVLTTSPGQGSTTWAVGLAWSAAETRRVRLIDADPAVGTVADLLDIEGRSSLENAFGPYGVQPTAVEAQSITLDRRPNLTVVPGFRQWELRAGAVVSRVGPMLSELPDEVVIVDLGCPFEPPDAGARPAVLMLSEYFDALFIVVRPQRDLLARAFRLLDAAPVPRARLVIARPPHRKEMQRALALIRQQLPEMGDPLECDWDHNRVLAGDLSGTPVHTRAMFDDTGLGGNGEATTAVRGRRRLVPFLSRGSAQ